ncbi:MAG: hypothetical protein WCV50_02900 [Patescibacteria group bacterium]|jgi:tRNA A58 N-methylase Trm61
MEILIYIALLLGILFVFGTAAYAGWVAAPWLPVFKKDIQRILNLAGIQPGDVVYDLGSGDGRVIVAIANNSSAKIVVGYEISFIPYIWSKIRIRFLGLNQRVEIRGADFLSRDLSQATVIFCFLTPKAMKKLGPKFERELRPGTRIISYSFSMPNWQPVETDRPSTKHIPIYKYIKK